VADFNKAIQLDPQDAKALYVRGLAKRRNGDVTIATPTWPRPRRSIQT
jgi:cytochrome c-type biogenesis protein CcmH/NrfG